MHRQERIPTSRTIFKAALTKETKVDLRILHCTHRCRMLTDRLINHLTFLANTRLLQEVTCLALAFPPLKTKILMCHHQTSLNKKNHTIQVLFLLDNPSKTACLQ